MKKFIAGAAICLLSFTPFLNTQAGAGNPPDQQSGEINWITSTCGNTVGIYSEEPMSVEEILNHADALEELCALIQAWDFIY